MCAHFPGVGCICSSDISLSSLADHGVRRPDFQAASFDRSTEKVLSFFYNFASNSAATVYFLMHCLSVASLHLEGAASRKSFSMICLPCLLVMLAIVRQLEVQFLLVSIHPLSQLQACAILCSGFFDALHSLPLLAAFFSQPRRREFEQDCIQ